MFKPSELNNKSADSARDIVVMLRPKFNMPVKTYTSAPAQPRPQTAVSRHTKPLIYNIGTPFSTARGSKPSIEPINLPKKAEWAFKKMNPHVYEKLYGEAKTYYSRRMDKGKVYEDMRLKSEKDEIEKAKQRMKDSARLCSDTRSHEMREQDLIQKRLKWNKKRVEIQRNRQEEEMRECTFTPDTQKRVKP